MLDVNEVPLFARSNSKKLLDILSPTCTQICIAASMMGITCLMLRQKSFNSPHNIHLHMYLDRPRCQPAALRSTIAELRRRFGWDWTMANVFPKLSNRFNWPVALPGVDTITKMTAVLFPNTPIVVQWSIQFPSAIVQLISSIDSNRPRLAIWLTALNFHPPAVRFFLFSF